MNFTPFPTLETKRLVLRKLRIEDAPELFVYRSNDEIMKYIARPRATSIDDAKELIVRINDLVDKNEVLNWGITLKEEDIVIGTIGFVRFKKDHFRAEIGYMLSIPHQNQGIMHEAIEKVIEYGFKHLQLHSIEAVVDPRNEASQKLLLKNKFVKEAYFKEDFFYEGQFLDSTVYSLLITDYYQ